MVNATQQFVSKAMRGRLNKQRFQSKTGQVTPKVKVEEQAKRLASAEEQGG